jgi:hypothetical protein
MDEATKLAVAERAKGRCEYCHLPEAHVLTPFQFEHIIAKQHRGKTTLPNLAYSCLRCNLHKGPNLTGIDPKTRQLARLFHPRRHVWGRHFRWDKALLVGRTPVGRATVEVLKMNDPERVALRGELLEQGLLPQE